MSNRIRTALRQIGPKFLLQAAILAVVLVSAGLLANRYRFEEVLGWLAFSDSGDAGWLHGRLAFVATGALFTAIGGPRQAVCFFAAYLFGLWQGSALALAASAAGALTAYLFALSFSGAARRVIRGRVDVARRMWERNAFSLTLILRLLPVGSNLLANLSAGAAHIPLAPFLAGSVLGYTPQTLVFAMLGAGVNVGSREQVALSVALFVLSALLGVWVYANYRKRLKNGA